MSKGVMGEQSYLMDTYLWEEETDPEDDHDGRMKFVKRFQENMSKRFALVSRYCDTSVCPPITFNTLKKLMYGGDEVLDYVNVYATRGNPEENVPDHWHYVSFGLSDLHGNLMRTPTPSSSPPIVSGMGFEISFRLKAPITESVPQWPVDLLQKLGRYIYSSPDCVISPGDHVTWGGPLHGNTSVPCKINHLLVTQDLSIPKLETPTGTVDFYQIVGVTQEEVEMAQRWNCKSVLNLFKQQNDLGGNQLVTDVFRTKSITEMYPEVKAIVAAGIENEGSDLNGVGGRALWTQNSRYYSTEKDWWGLSDAERQSYIEFEQLPVQEMNEPNAENRKDDEIDFLEQEMALITKQLQTAQLGEPSSSSSKHPEVVDIPKHILNRLVFYPKVHLTMSPETAKILPLALRGRLQHNRHFTIKDAILEDAITLVSGGMAGSFTSQQKPFAAYGPWLHIQLETEHQDKIANDIENLFAVLENPSPRFLCWPESRLALTILDFKD